MEIEQIYSQFLDSKSNEYKEKHKGMEKLFSASSAGHCYKKHMFKITGASEKQIEARSQRIMRLGTLVHQDFEDAIKYYINNNTDKFATSTDGSGTGEPTQFYTRVDGKQDKVFFIEHRIHIPEYNIVGHLDFAVADKNNKDVYVYDYKTAASYKWSLKFGRKYKDKNPNFNYEMQLSTYLLGLQKHFEEINFQAESIQMSIIWYNKDTSRMREEKIQLEYIDMAINYWEELNQWKDSIEKENPELDNHDIVNSTIPRFKEVGVPFQDWECNYCPYEHICK